MFLEKYMFTMRDGWNGSDSCPMVTVSIFQSAKENNSQTESMMNRSAVLCNENSVTLYSIDKVTLTSQAEIKKFVQVLVGNHLRRLSLRISSISNNIKPFETEARLNNI
jgi:hypothetical protein